MRRGRTEYYLVDELHAKRESPELRRQVSVFRTQWAPVAHEAGIELVDVHLARQHINHR